MTGEEGDIKVLAAVTVDAQISSRSIAQGSGMSQASVLRILHSHNCIRIASPSREWCMAMVLIILLTFVYGH